MRRPSRPSRPDSDGTNEWVEDDLGSLERHCSEMSLLLSASSEEYGGGALTDLPRGGSGGGGDLGRSCLAFSAS